MVRLAAALLVGALGLSACGAAPPATADRGATLYANYCAACHLASGEGVANLRPALAGSALVNGDPEALARWVMYGQRAETNAKGPYPAVMPPFHRLSDEDLALVLTTLRTGFGNHAGALDAALIARVRTAHH